ncbi:MAG: hypothetical protein AAGI45_02830 [Cyanobacteria bacterium P01_H01_bin.26]
MAIQNNKPARWSNQPGPIVWQVVPEFIQNTLRAQGCILLKHHHTWPVLKHIRFQYVPLSYRGCLYYLQRWSQHEWGVSPRQIIFPEDTVCTLETLSNGSLLSSRVKQAVAKSYGLCPDSLAVQLSFPTSRYTDDPMLSLAG